MYITSLGASPQIGEIYNLFVILPVLSFFSFQRSARTARPIFALYCSNDVVQPKNGPFGVRTMSDIIRGNCAPKSLTDVLVGL